ncbi:hypothetical protein DM02DRAFT_695121 [Periconia macrospinosa]|uniref:Rhodopsin domain-containing protein n=1 Tax=Periconia macrospinosa TaxID=97972 RepID=A0A2V1D6U4_9PLEO|nr:hypothetical protein DM02DRAFT_695121 [Periconia macrospinosa]
MAAPQIPADELAYQLANKDQNRGPIIIIVSSLLLGLSTAAVIARFVARRVLKVKIGWDDWLTIPSLAMIATMVVELTYGEYHTTKFGLGRHMIATNPAEGYRILQIGFFLSLSYTLLHLFIKLSILLFYIRIFGLFEKWFKISVYCVMAYVVGWSLSQVRFILGQCQPLDYFWQRVNITLDPPAKGVCPVNTEVSSLSTSILNIIADFLILILPISHLVNLQLILAKKVALLSVFLVGTLETISNIWTGAAVDGYLWTIIEASVGLMCACFPIVGPLFKILRSKVSSSNGSRAAGYHMGSAQKIQGSDIGEKRKYNKRPFNSEVNTVDGEEELKPLSREDYETRQSRREDDGTRISV